MHFADNMRHCVNLSLCLSSPFNAIGHWQCHLCLFLGVHLCAKALLSVRLYLISAVHR